MLFDTRNAKEQRIRDLLIINGFTDEADKFIRGTDHALVADALGCCVAMKNIDKGDVVLLKAEITRQTRMTGEIIKE